jgi:hypothetical protein
MVDVPREGEFEANIALYWQKRARVAEKAIGESCEDMRSEYRTCSLAADLTEQLEQAAVKAISQKGLIDNLNVVVTNQAEQLEQVTRNSNANWNLAVKAKQQLEQIKPYMKHRFHCVWHKANCQNKCTCGLQAILEQS